MEDSANEDQDRKIAETYGKSYTEAQKAEIEGTEEFDSLEREVGIDVGRAWVKYARDEINPVLSYDQFKKIEDWYAEEVRQLNNDFAEDGQAEDMPVPVTVRVLGAVTKMAIAFARASLREEVTERDVTRAKKLGKRLVKQNWDGEKFSVTKNTRTDRKETHQAIYAYLQENPASSIDEIAEGIDKPPRHVENDVEKLYQRGEIMEPKTGEYRLT